MAKIMDPILPILSILGYWAIILGSFGGPGDNCSCLFPGSFRSSPDFGPGCRESGKESPKPTIWACGKSCAGASALGIGFWEGSKFRGLNIHPK